jgi:hypothetical protein
VLSPDRLYKTIKIILPIFCTGALASAEQVIGHEGETATFLSRCQLNFSLRVIGRAPHQLRRLAAIAHADTTIDKPLTKVSEQKEKENIYEIIEQLHTKFSQRRFCRLFCILCAHRRTGANAGRRT